jgi:hypothetical protein
MDGTNRMTAATQHSQPVEIDCKKVQGRRALKFSTIEEALADGEMLAACPNVRMLGNHSLGSLLAHLGNAINSSIDGMKHRAPWFIRALAPMFKRRILEKGLSPGFKLPKGSVSKSFPVMSPADGIELYRRAIARITNEKMTSLHPAFGKMTHDDWHRLHCQHAAMHLSFAVPA